jgi:Carboxypeptidase regulatory-like domain
LLTVKNRVGPSSFVPSRSRSYCEESIRMTTKPSTFRRIWPDATGTLVLCIGLAVPLGGCAAAHGGAAIGSSDQPPELSGTISGVVRAAGSNTPLSARTVTAIEVGSGSKYEASTAANGGYTMKVPMGRYRLRVELRENEVTAQAPDEVVLNRSDLDAGRDFSIAVKP